jgi:hypothetical protein
MSVAIDEVTAEVTAPESRGPQPQQSQPQTASPADVRRQREQFERMQQRAARVCAD